MTGEHEKPHNGGIMTAIHPSLPGGFTNTEDILDGKVNVGSRVKAIGLVTDVRAPMPTNGAGKLNDFTTAASFINHVDTKQTGSVRCGSSTSPSNTIMNSRCC